MQSYLSFEIVRSNKMLAILLFSVATLTAASTTAHRLPPLIQNKFITRLDHSRAQDERVVEFVRPLQKMIFKSTDFNKFIAQTYYANLEHYRPLEQGPFYININDATDLSTQWIEHGLMERVAAQTGAALFTFNTRYFGTNIPTEFLTLDDLQYLENEQILADISHFIAHLHREFETEQNIVILFGLGVGATLSEWARMKFPHLIDAVWASNGIFEIELTSFGVGQRLEQVFERFDPACNVNIRSALFELDDLVANGNGEKIQRVLNLCGSAFDTSDSQEVAHLFDTLMNVITRTLNDKQ